MNRITHVYVKTQDKLAMIFLEIHYIIVLLQQMHLQCCLFKKDEDRLKSQYWKSNLHKGLLQNYNQSFS
jgi:hypothetical protein